MIDQLNLISQSWFSWMFSMFWQISLLIIVISGVDLLIRTWAWPQVRYALWSLVLIKLVLPPTFTFTGSIVPNIRAELPSKIDLVSEAQTTEKSNSDIKMSKSDKPPLIENEVLSTPNITESSTTSADLNWKVYLMALWIFGIIIFAIVLGRKILRLKKWHIEQETKRNIPPWFHKSLLKVAKILSIERLPAIVFSNKALTPAVYGIFRPVLLLPEKYIDDLSEEEAEHVLLHELAHIKRGDLFVHGVTLVLQIIYWFNPLLIWTRKQMKHVREICCDLTIANILRERTKQYKETLVNTARELLTESTEPGMGLLGLFEEPYQLISRLKWLNKETWKNRTIAFGSAVFISLLFTAFVLPMGEMEYGIGPSFIKSDFISENIEVDDYLARIEKLTPEINNAFIDWDFNKIRTFYTDDAIIDEVQHPTVFGLDNLMNYFKKQKAEGVNFTMMENFVLDYWKEGNNLFTIESFVFKIHLEGQGLKLSGKGSLFTIWEIGEDDSIKIKYSIVSLNELPSIT